jgi:hypothetical protein
MTTTVLFDDEELELASAAAEHDGRLWLAPAELEALTGWALKPEGLCRAEACVPLPRDGSWLDDAGRVDLATFAERLGRPVVHDDAHAIWAFGESASARGRALDSLQAPDFTLPDLDGKLHSLADHRGRKVFLYAWGSY